MNNKKQILLLITQLDHECYEYGRGKMKSEILMNITHEAGPRQWITEHENNINKIKSQIEVLLNDHNC